jgi:hypothetical protein
MNNDLPEMKTFGAHELCTTYRPYDICLSELCTEYIVDEYLVRNFLGSHHYDANIAVS